MIVQFKKICARRASPELVVGFAVLGKTSVLTIVSLRVITPPLFFLHSFLVKPHSLFDTFPTFYYRSTPPSPPATKNL